VRLAALNLEMISRVDLEGSGQDPGFLGFRVHLNSRVSHFLLNVTFLCKFRRIRVLGCTSELLSR